MAKKPYIYESLEGWLQISRKKDWTDPSVNPHDLAPYSEFLKPYASDKDISYPEWEWTWPSSDFPPIDDITYPDPVENECSIDENCVWAGIIGPTEMDCGDCYTYSQAHVWYGCDIAPWWAAYGAWELESAVAGGKCYLLFSGPVMATVCCEDGSFGSFTLTYIGPLDCKGSISVQVSCDICCDDFTVSGAATANDNSTWVGTIDPPCPGAECTVESNSGCVGFSCGVNEAGSEATVGIPDDACGSFTVTVVDGNPNPDCNATSSTSVRINNTGAPQPNSTWQTVSSCELGAGNSCDVGGYSCRSGVVINAICYMGTDAKTRYSHSRECCYTNHAGLGCGTTCSNCPPQDCTCPPCSACTGLCGTSCSCFGTGTHWRYVYQQEWKCTCV